MYVKAWKGFPLEKKGWKSRYRLPARAPSADSRKLPRYDCPAIVLLLSSVNRLSVAGKLSPSSDGLCWISIGLAPK